MYTIFLVFDFYDEKVRDCPFCEQSHRGYLHLHLSSALGLKVEQSVSRLFVALLLLISTTSAVQWQGS